MFTYDLSQWWWLAIAIVMAAFCIVQACAGILVYSGLGGFRWSYPAIVAGILTAIFVVANALPLIISYNTDHARAATARELAGHFELISGKQYPLYISETGYPVNIAEDGYFTSETDLSAVPVGNLELTFHQGQQLTSVSLPMNVVTLNLTEAEQSTIVISIKDTVLEESMAYYEVEYGWCDFRFYNLWLQCDRQVVSRELVIGENAQLAGLSLMVAGYRSGSQILLSPQDYSALE